MNKKNIITSVLLLLMLISGYFLWSGFNDLKKQRKKLEDDQTKLAADTTDLVRKRNGLDLRIAQLDTLIRSQNKIIESIKIKTKDTSLSRLISKYNSIATPEKQALKLEKEGFEHLIKNQFDSALNKFTQAEKTSTSFHMAYEISRLLKSKKGNYSDPSDIKKQIIKSYSWKAPPDLLAKLKMQLK